MSNTRTGLLNKIKEAKEAHQKYLAELKAFDKKVEGELITHWLTLGVVQGVQVTTQPFGMDVPEQELWVALLKTPQELDLLHDVPQIKLETWRSKTSGDIEEMNLLTTLEEDERAIQVDHLSPDQLKEMGVTF